MSLLITDAIQGFADPTYTQLPTGIVDPACLQVVMINGAMRITIKKNSLDGSYFTGDFIPNGSITQAQLANNSVGTPQLQDGCVTTAKLADHSVTQIKLAFGAVTNTEIASGTIISANIAPNAIVTNLIKPGSVTGPCIANGAITSINFAPGAVDHAALQAASVWVPNLGADVLALIQGTGLPPGVILPTGRSSPPNGYLFCDGAFISRSVYASLYAAIGTVYGPGDGATTFNVPDLRGRTIVGAGAGPGLSNRPLGVRGGEEYHYLSVNEMPSHSHTVVDGGHSHPLNEPYHSHSISQTPHNHGIYDPGHQHLCFFSTNTDNSGLPRPGIDSVPTWGYPGGQGGYDYAVSYGHANICNLQAWTSPVGTGIQISAANANVSVVQTRIGITIAGALSSVWNQATGGNAPHENMPPWLACNYVIKT